MPKKNVNSVSKEYLIRKIEESGCKMLKGKLKGTETKEEVITYLKVCHCPKIHELFSGI